MSTDETSRPGSPGHDAGSAPPATGAAPAPGATPFGTTPPGATPPRVGFFDSIRRIGIARSDDRWVGGVAGGVAERFGVDPLLVRGLLVLSFFLTGAGLVLYALAWALLPERRDGRIHLQEAGRGLFDVALLGAAVTLVVGFAWSDGPWSWWGASGDWVEAFFWIAIWVGVAVLIVKLVRDRRARSAPGAAVPPSATVTSESAPATQPFVPAPPGPYVAEPQAYTPPSVPMPPAVPAPPPRPPVEGPGGRTVGVVVGLILLAGALLLVAERVGVLDLPWWGVAWLGAAMVIVGAGIVASGVRGRRGGGLTVLAVLGIVAALVAWPLTGYGGSAARWVVPEGATVVSDGTITPTSVAEASDGVHVRFGEVTLDLTRLDLSDVVPGEPVVVPLSMAAGSTEIVVPDDVAVEADVDMVAGNIVWRVDGEYRSIAGVGVSTPTRLRSAEVDELGGAQLLLHVAGSAGEITIRENR